MQYLTDWSDATYQNNKFQVQNPSIQSCLISRHQVALFLSDESTFVNFLAERPCSLFVDWNITPTCLKELFSCVKPVPKTKVVLKKATNPFSFYPCSLIFLWFTSCKHNLPVTNSVKKIETCFNFFPVWHQ